MRDQSLRPPRDQSLRHLARGGMRLRTPCDRSPLHLLWLILTPFRSLLETVLGIWSTPSNPVLSFGWGDSGDKSVSAEAAYFRVGYHWQALLLEAPWPGSVVKYSV